MLRRGLLVCGVLSSIVYLAANIVVPMRWDAYDWASQTISELSAIGAPTRGLWIALMVPYAILLAAFGVGVRASAGTSRGLRAAGTLIVVDALFGITWPPMHLRETLAAGGGTLTDTMHIAYTAINALLMFAAIGLSTTAFGRRYRAYCIATVVVEMAFGTMTGLQSPALQANLPTPWLGVWERLVLVAMMAWPVVLAVALLRRADPLADPRTPVQSTTAQVRTA